MDDMKLLCAGPDRAADTCSANGKGHLKIQCPCCRPAAIDRVTSLTIVTPAVMRFVLPSTCSVSIRFDCLFVKELLERGHDARTPGTRRRR